MSLIHLVILRSIIYATSRVTTLGSLGALGWIQVEGTADGNLLVRAEEGIPFLERGRKAREISRLRWDGRPPQPLLAGKIRVACAHGFQKVAMLQGNMVYIRWQSGSPMHWIQSNPCPEYLLKPITLWPFFPLPKSSHEDSPNDLPCYSTAFAVVVGLVWMAISPGHLLPVLQKGCN